MATQRLCSIPDCGKPTVGLGLCRAHYKRLKRHGDPLGGRNPHGSPRQYFETVILPYTGDKCLIWPFAKGRKGYGTIWGKDGKFHNVSREVCETIHGPPPTPDHHAAHSCGNGKKACCTPRHVHWATRSENEQEKIDHGTSNRGERHGRSKLLPDQIRAIYTLKDRLPSQQIADRFGVSRSHVSCILRGETWRHLFPAEETPNRADGT